MQLPSWFEPFSVFSRGDEGLYHFCLSEIAVEAVELIPPEVVTLKVERRLRRIVRVSTFFLFSLRFAPSP